MILDARESPGLPASISLLSVLCAAFAREQPILSDFKINNKLQIKLTKNKSINKRNGRLLLKNQNANFRCKVKNTNKIKQSLIGKKEKLSDRFVEDK